MRNEPYKAFIRTLPCACGCNGDEIQVHHIVGYGLSGMGTKASDLASMPLAAICHQLLHTDPKRWEEKHGSQDIHCLATIWAALNAGVI